MSDQAKRPAADAIGALESTIATLKANVLAGAKPLVLRSRNIGLLCEHSQSPEVFLLQRAAAELGAHVSLVHPGLDEEDALLAVQETGRMLGRLYDALICVDLPAQVVDRLREAAGIPAVADLAGEWIALRALRAEASDDGRYLLQALLINVCS